ncbi:VanZ family protein [Bacillus pumilus]|uniref:VanZ family protein n=1 Tax=Bacillus pumilus TaxID=1408 RepID=UPI002112840C|nr:VanZ family protein [Bacillus pumilus]UUD42126.1 VanZ family protein [Bacillus pumilus]
MITNGLAIFIGLLMYIINILFRIYKIFILKQKFYPIEKSIFIFVFFAYISGLLYVTLFPIPIDVDLINDRISEGFEEENNFIPLRSIINIISESSLTTILTQIGGNLLLLFPLAIFIQLVFNNLTLKIRGVFIIGFLSSLIIEMSQLTISNLIGFTYRSFDVDDLILNTLGFFIGYFSYKFVYPIRNLFFE